MNTYAFDVQLAEREEFDNETMAKIYSIASCGLFFRRNEINYIHFEVLAHTLNEAFNGVANLVFSIGLTPLGYENWSKNGINYPDIRNFKSPEK